MINKIEIVVHTCSGELTIKFLDPQKIREIMEDDTSLLSDFLGAIIVDASLPETPDN